MDSIGNWSPSVGHLLTPLNLNGTYVPKAQQESIFLMVLMVKSLCFAMFVTVFVVETIIIFCEGLKKVTMCIVMFEADVITNVSSLLGKV